MQPAALKLLASIITVVMSFLGWDTADYARFLPPNLQIEIARTIEVSSTTPYLLLPPIETVAVEEAKPTAAKPALKPADKPKVIPVKPAVPYSPAVAPAVIPPPAPVTPKVEPAVVPEAPKADTPPMTVEQRIRAATINIYCTAPRGGQIAHYSGSGVIIDPSGIILTNAHVAEHVLLEQAGRATCFIRTGSPASNSYKAKVVYLPDAWIEANKFNLQSMTLTGTGENDYAVLMITSRVSKTAYDIPLPYLAPDTSGASVGSSITIAGYPILSQSVSILTSGLYVLAQPSSITRVSGYDGVSADVINTGSTNLAEHGTSGGAIVGSGGTLIGLIDSAVVDPQTGRNAVQGITLSYINRSLQSHGKSIRFLIDNASSEADSFASNKVQYLSGML